MTGSFLWSVRVYIPKCKSSKANAGSGYNIWWTCGFCRQPEKHQSQNIFELIYLFVLQMIVVTCEIAVWIGQDHQSDQVFSVVVSWQYLKYAVMDLVMAGFSLSLWQHSHSFVSLSLRNPSLLTDGRPRHHRPNTSAPHRLNAAIPGKRVRAQTRRHG